MSMYKTSKLIIDKDKGKRNKSVALPRDKALSLVKFVIKNQTKVN